MKTTNRIIKFRAWDKKSNRIKTGVESYLGAYLPPNGNIHGHHILMQFTGLKDKNGKEIYEGDIVNYDTKAFENGLNAIVEWSGSGFYIAKHIPLVSLVEKFDTDIEVIGNIYENSELLEK
jgi:uncharacterized phage protein (TIGR01671 family)